MAAGSPFAHMLGCPFPLTCSIRKSTIKNERPQKSSQSYTDVKPDRWSRELLGEKGKPYTGESGAFSLPRSCCHVLSILSYRVTQTSSVKTDWINTEVSSLWRHLWVFYPLGDLSHQQKHTDKVEPFKPKSTWLHMVLPGFYREVKVLPAAASETKTHPPHASYLIILCFKTECVGLCVSVWVCACVGAYGVQRDIRSLGAWVISSPKWVLRTELWSTQEQWLLLATEPSLQLSWVCSDSKQAWLCF